MFQKTHSPETQSRGTSTCVCRCCWSQSLIRWAYGLICRRSSSDVEPNRVWLSTPASWITAASFSFLYFLIWVASAKPHLTCFHILKIFFIGQQRILCHLLKGRNRMPLISFITFFQKQDALSRTTCYSVVAGTHLHNFFQPKRGFKSAARLGHWPADIKSWNVHV